MAKLFEARSENTGNANALAGGSYTITRTMDGFGRVVKVVDSRTNSIVETVYDSCSCSSTGKQTKVSNPYLAGQTPLWTTTTSDALGRTKTVQAPDNSTTTYNYYGNGTEIIDPAGKKKLYGNDALGNLVTVGEPDASGNYNVLTSYTYDVAGRLRIVSMNGGLQTRTFNYNAQNQLTSEVHPESGTTTYTYNAVGMVLTKTDARGNQVVTFEYDSYNRMTRSYQSAGTGGHEKRFYYDTYPADPGTNIYGRLAAIEWTPPAVTATGGSLENAYKHVFGYTTYGAVTRSKLTATGTFTPTDGSPGTPQVTTMEAQFTWTMQGEMATILYPHGRSLYNKFDSAGRLNGLHQLAAGGYPDADMVLGTSYTTAGQLATMDFYLDWPLTGEQRRETRTYNNLLQMTGIRVARLPSGAAQLDLTYNYAAGQNNGRITSETNNLTNTTVSFTTTIE